MDTQENLIKNSMNNPVDNSIDNSTEKFKYEILLKKNSMEPYGTLWNPIEPYGTLNNLTENSGDNSVDMSSE